MDPFFNSKEFKTNSVTATIPIHSAQPIGDSADVLAIGKRSAQTAAGFRAIREALQELIKIVDLTEIPLEAIELSHTNNGGVIISKLPNPLDPSHYVISMTHTKQHATAVAAVSNPNQIAE